jgi:signal transduction histidine kinase
MAEPLYQHFSDWNSLICDLLMNGNSVAIGLFNLECKLIEANKPMRYFLGITSDKLQPENQLINPKFASLIESGNDGLIFEGYMTIGNYANISYVLLSKVYRRKEQIMIFAEADVPDLFEENKKMSTLNQEVNNLQRQLIKEKRNLQNALAELKDTQQMLIHSEKMNAMGQLVAGVAHELNNPISFVYSNLFSIEKYINEVYKSYNEVEVLIGEKASEELVTNVAKIRDKNDVVFLMEDIADMAKESRMGVERVKTIVEDLRRFSRLDESAIKQIELIENIRSTISLVRAEINNKNIDFRFNSPEKLEIECYPGQLNQAILNVLINAIQAVDERGKVELSVNRVADDVVISIADNGPGIPNDIKSRIFEPFFTTKPVGSGTGLGLSITYKIICDLHHGSIDVESELNKETNFILKLPAKNS